VLLLYQFKILLRKFPLVNYLKYLYDSTIHNEQRLDVVGLLIDVIKIHEEFEKIQKLIPIELKEC